MSDDPDARRARALRREAARLRVRLAGLVQQLDDFDAELAADLDAEPVAEAVNRLLASLTEPGPARPGEGD